MAKRGRKPKKKRGRPRKDKAEAPAPKKKRKKRRSASFTILKRVTVADAPYLSAVANCSSPKEAREWILFHGKEGEAYRIGPLSDPITVDIEKTEKRSIVMVMEDEPEVATETEATDEVQA